MTRPRLLDLYCGWGGAGVGYERAGFDVLGIDIQRCRPPFPFIQADALEPPVDLRAFDVIHASPPCQHYSIMRNLPWLSGRDYPALIQPTRDMLVASGVPWIIENVAGAATHRCEMCTVPMGTAFPAISICGLAMGLPTYRHRWFESNVALWNIPHQRHPETIFPGGNLNRRYAGSDGMTGGYVGSEGKSIVALLGHTSGFGGKSAREAVGLEWMSRDQATQAIPPAYTQFIGEQLLSVIDGMTGDQAAMQL